MPFWSRRSSAAKDGGVGGGGRRKSEGMATGLVGAERLSEWSNRDPDEHLEKILASDATRDLLQAVVVVEDAIHSRKHSPEITRSTYRLYRFYHSQAYALGYTALVLAVMLLAEWEPVSTLREVPSEVDLTALRLFELFFTSLLVLDCAVLYKHLGDQCFRSRWRRLKIGVVMFTCANVLVCIADPGIFRFHRFLRPLLLIARFSNVRRVFQDVLQSLPSIAMVTLLLGFLVLFFGVFAYLLFQGISFDTCHYSENETSIRCSTWTPQECSQYFSSVGESMEALFILLTTANFPDVMMPAYACTNWSPLFFVTYLVIGLYILFNLLLAVVVDSFQGRAETRTVRNILSRVDALDSAFDLMVREEKGETKQLLTLDKWTKFMHLLKPKLTKGQVQLLFLTMNQSRTGLLNKGEFRTLSTFVDVKLTPADKLVRQLPMYQKSSMHTRWLAARYWAWRLMSMPHSVRFCDALVVINGVTVMTSFFFTDPRVTGPLDNICTAFLWIFTLEISLNLMAFGWKRYWGDSGFNKLDVVAVGLGILCTLGGSVFSVTSTRAALFLRVVRLLRTLRSLKGFALVIQTAVQIIPPFLRYVAMLICVFYVFAIGGMEAFGGLITGPADASEEVMKSSYGINNYWALNFNSLRRAYVAEFALLIVNNWAVLQEGYVAATGSLWARLYFTAFYVVCVVVCLSIVSAFLLDAFDLQISDNRAVMVEKKESMYKVMIRRAAMEHGFITAPMDIEIEGKAHMSHVYERLFAKQVDEQLQKHLAGQEFFEDAIFGSRMVRPRGKSAWEELDVGDESRDMLALRYVGRDSSTSARSLL